MPIAQSQENTQLLSEAADRILASAAFRRTPRLSQLLKYIVSHSAAGDHEALKEAAIGQAVFGRPADYNAAEDNIVRSNVRQLRLKLGEYYAAEAGSSFGRLTIPKGGYSVELVPASVPAPADSSEPLPPIPASPSPNRRRRLWLFAIGAILLVAASFALGFLAHDSSIDRSSDGPPALISLLTHSSQNLPVRKLLVVVPDAGVQLYQHLTNHTVSLEDYFRGNFDEARPAVPLTPAFRENRADLFHNSITQSFFLNLLPQIARGLPGLEIAVHHPSTLTAADLEQDNSLLISGPFGNPWVQLFDRKLNFQIRYNPGDHTTSIVNLKPQPGESSDYANYAEASRTQVCYARVAYLFSRSRRSRVLLAGGPHHISTEAAGQFFLQPGSLQSICKLLHVDKPANLPSFEFVLEARTLGGAAWDTRIVAHRTIPRD
jgi:hypothetical protein